MLKEGLKGMNQAKEEKEAKEAKKTGARKQRLGKGGGGGNRPTLESSRQGTQKVEGKGKGEKKREIFTSIQILLVSLIKNFT